MALQALPRSLQNNVKFAKFVELIAQFNQIVPDDTIQQLFYLQAINHELYKHKFNGALFDWVNSKDNNGWRAHLRRCGIHPQASFFLTGIEFARAVKRVFTQKNFIAPSNEQLKVVQLMRKRDNLFTDNNFTRDYETYIQTSLQLDLLAQTDPATRKKISNQYTVLRLAKDKIQSVMQENDRTRQSSDAPPDKTTQLGSEDNNNVNFRYEVQGWPAPLVFRVEDRAQLDLEQQLQSSKASKYFIEDYAVFMMEFQSKDDDEIEYKPVALSQFARGGNLREFAQQLHNGWGGTDSVSAIPMAARTFFNQIADFCSLLMEDGIYHPDIKLSNFLCSGHDLLVSDRKTLTNNPNPAVNKIRTSPGYAPTDFVVWVKPDGTDFRPGAGRVHIDMPSFMAFQLGMALKEFLILTQLSELPDPMTFRDPDHSAASYFNNPSKEIINLSILVQELTRPEPTHRLSIYSFQRLLKNISLNLNDFYTLLERELPSRQLELDTHINEIRDILRNPTLKGEALYNQVNPLLERIANPEPIKKTTRVIQAGENMAPRETRLTRLAEQLAFRCYQDSSQQYFIDNVVRPLETALVAADWNRAPWYRKLAYYVSFGNYAVDKVTTVQEITLPLLDVNSPEFQRYLPQLEFLPAQVLIRDLGAERAARFEDYIEFITTPPPEPALSDENSSESEPDTDDPDYNTMEIRPGKAVIDPFETLSEDLFTDAGQTTMVVRDDDAANRLSGELPDVDSTSTMVVRCDGDDDDTDSLSGQLPVAEGTSTMVLVSTNTMQINADSASTSEPATRAPGKFKGYNPITEEPDAQAGKRQKPRHINSLFLSRGNPGLSRTHSTLFHHGLRTRSIKDSFDYPASPIVERGLRF